MRNRLDMAVNVALVSACLLVGANAGLTLWQRVRHGGASTAGRAAQDRPSRPPEAPLPAEPISIQDSLAFGSETAPVVIIEYSDYQCPYCERFDRDTWSALNDGYVKPGRVRWIYRHLPLESIHTAAFTSAEAAECAGAQGRFSEFNSLLFRNRQHLDPPSLFRYAAEANLDEAAFTACMKGTTRGKVRKDIDSASALGVTGTPSFLLGTREADGRIQLRERLVGAVPFSQFQASIDKTLSNLTAPSRSN